MNLVWCTDIHLNFPGPKVRMAFYEKVRDAGDVVLVTGDIAEADSLGEWLSEMSLVVGKPIYFVLGNHDFYGGSVASVREQVSILTRDNPFLIYLRDQVIELTPDTALVGIDGWADAQLGAPWKGRLGMSDWDHIKDYADVQARFDLNKRMMLALDYGRNEASVLRATLNKAASKYNRVIIGTHIPPYEEATWYMGKHSDEDWLPWFSCKSTGDVLDDTAFFYPHVKFEVYCGHTHGSGVHERMDNLIVHTGRASYGLPDVNKVLTLGDG